MKIPESGMIALKVVSTTGVRLSHFRSEIDTCRSPSEINIPQLQIYLILCLHFWYQSVLKCVYFHYLYFILSRSQLHVELEVLTEPHSKTIIIRHTH